MDPDVWRHICKDVAASDMDGLADRLLDSRVAALLCVTHGISPSPEELNTVFRLSGILQPAYSFYITGVLREFNGSAFGGFNGSSFGIIQPLACSPLSTYQDSYVGRSILGLPLVGIISLESS